MRSRFFTIIASLAVAISLAALFVSPAHAEPPFTAYGTGLTDGDVVDVYLEGRYCDSAVADGAGNWGPISIWDTGPCAPESDDPITFLLNNQPTNETEIWAPGGAPANVATGTVLTPALQGLPGQLQPGINLTIWNGVSLEQLLTHAAAQGCVVDSFWVTISSHFVVFISGAPDRVNQEMRDSYPDDMPPGTVVLVACGPGAFLVQAPFIAYGTGLTAGDVVGILDGNTLCAGDTADADGNWGPIQIAETIGPCAFSEGHTINFRVNGLLANETETFVPGGHPADTANGTALTIAASIWIRASLGHDWVIGETQPGEELTLEIYDSEGGDLLGTFARLADGGGTVRWTAADLGIDLLPGMHLILYGSGVDRSITMRSVSLGEWTGGTIDDFAAAATIVNAHSFYIEHNENMVFYVIGAPAFVNQAFIDTFSPSFEATAPEVGVPEGGGTLYAPLYDSATALVLIPGTERLLVEWNSDRVTALGFDAFASIELTVRDAPGGSVLFNGATTADTYGYASWRSYDIGMPDGFWPGFEFTVTDGAHTRVLVVSNTHIQRIDVDAGIVEGIAPPNSLVKLDILRDPLKPWVTTANPSGHWSFDFGATGTIEWTASLVAETTDADGDRTAFYARPPYIYATFPTYIRAYYFLAATSATIQVFDEPGGTLIGAASGETSAKSGSVSFYIPALGFELESGMLVRVSDGTHTKELIVDELTIDSLDLDADTLGGSAPPGTTLRVNLTSRETWLYLQTTADGTGRWSLDVAGDLDLGVEHFIQVSSIDGENDFTYVWREPPFLYELTLDQGTLTPTFDRETTSYATSVGNSVDTITLTAAVWTATVTIDGEPSGWNTPVEIDLAVGANPIEIVATHTDGLSVITYNLTVTRAPVSIPPPVIILTPPRLAPTLVIVNDDGGDAIAEDFTVLLDDEAIEVGVTSTISSGAHTITVDGAAPFYDVDFSAVCSEGTFTALPGSLVNCTITLDDLPLTAVLGAPLPGSEALIDESLSLAADAFNLNGQTVVQASSAGTPPEITVIVPVEALPGDSDITVMVLPANELAIGETPPPGTLLIGGTAYVISITDALGEPITSFQLPITLSFALPEGTDLTPLVAYVFDEVSELWTVQPGAVVDGRYVVTPSHLTTFGLFEFQGSGGFTNPLPTAGVALSTAEGGTFLQLEQALQQADAISVFVSQAGLLVGYVPDAPAFVNQDFIELLGGAIPPGQLMIVVLGG